MEISRLRIVSVGLMRRFVTIKVMCGTVQQRFPIERSAIKRSVDGPQCLPNFSHGRAMLSGIAFGCWKMSPPRPLRKAETQLTMERMMKASLSMIIRMIKIIEAKKLREAIYNFCSDESGRADRPLQMPH